MIEEDGSEDVNDFLQRIRELGDKRDKEDEERTRKLEEEILQGRKERQARRAERARSISPTKDSPSNAGTPSSVHTMTDTPTHQSFLRGSIDSLQPSPSIAMDRGEDNVQSTGVPNTRSEMSRERNTTRALHDSQLGLKSSPTPSAAMPSRSGTLSWQQRPTSRGSTSAKSRPLSMGASENSAMRSPRATPGPTPLDVKEKEKELSRDQISHSLASKDPTWFRQTADRGAGSAAYRKNKEDDSSNTTSLTGSVRLPGFSRESTVEPEKEHIVRPESVRSSSPSRDDSVRGSSAWSQRFSSTASSSSTNPVGSPLPTLSSQRLEPPSSDTTSSKSIENTISRSPAMSPSQGRISPERMERPVSPTKGLGGFVQSAMLKRSDSVNKRWSAQAGTGLSRGNSIASNRSGYDGGLNALSGVGLSRETSPIASSRPGSSHSNATVTQREKSWEYDKVTAAEASTKDGFVKPALPVHSRARQNTSNDLQSSSGDTLDSSPPSSPSKTTEAKKWSPTKASWLESAINKPDSPKPKAPAPNQPSWMADINKAKTLRGSVDLGKSTSFKEVSTGGLLRSPPMGTTSKSPSLGSLGSLVSPSATTLSKVKGPDMPSDTNSRVKPDAQDDSDSTLPDIQKLHSPLEHGKSSSRTTAGELGPSSESIEPPKIENLASERSPKSPPILKPKPITPTKKDFRSTLKPRQISSDNEKSAEPEFKNVFGKLKRTETKNYVAPDELKNNILRGKAGLAVTGGPKKTERKDEFKESILKKKEEMKVGISSNATRKTSNSSLNSAQDSPAPEAIAKRNDLIRPESALGNRSISTDTSSVPAATELASRQSSLIDKPKLELPEKKTSAPARLQKESATGGKLADRFNPALAGLLQRGPSPLTGGVAPLRTMSPVNFKDENQTSAPVAYHNSASDPPQQLTHATKARARGPKRRPPTSTNTDNENTQPYSVSESTSPQHLSPSLDIPKITKLSSPHAEDAASVRDPLPMPLSNITNNSNKTIQAKSPAKSSSPTKRSASIEAKHIENSGSSSPEAAFSPQQRSPSITKAKSAKSPRAPGVRKPSASVVKPSNTASPSIATEAKAESSSPSRETMGTPKAQMLEKEAKAVSVASAAAHWRTSATTEIQPAPRARSPIKLPTRHDEEAATREAGLPDRDAQSPIGLGIDSMSLGPSPKATRSPPPPAKKPESIAHRVVSTTALPTPPQQTVESPTVANSDASRILRKFFGENLATKVKLDVDAQPILASRGTNLDSGKIKTLRKQIWEVSESGKRLPIPSHQEHILFEESLYLCTHVFGTASGKRTTEVYLWCGDGVSPPAIEDAQLFSKTAAKEAGGKLIILAQGKETSNFFEALGGIVITRRGSSSRFSSSAGAAATYMLCGRRHMGQIAFDEVDFSPASLCSGFPYIVSATSGRLYLWKGRGSGADELGCARLIGMDLGLTGEIEEVDEGKEPPAFWQAFPGAPKAVDMPQGHWHLKPGCEKYTTRLFALEMEGRPKSSSSFIWGRRGSAPALDDSLTAQVREVVPFTQKDLSAEGVFVLDAFFEIYIIVGAAAISKLPNFRAALLFAQEYGILAASMEDRPFVPVSTVVLEGVPAIVKSVFRKWDDRKVVTRESGDLVVVLLNSAVEATGG